MAAVVNSNFPYNSKIFTFYQSNLGHIIFLHFYHRQKVTGKTSKEWKTVLIKTAQLDLTQKVSILLDTNCVFHGRYASISSNFSQGCFCIHGKWRWEWSEADGTRKPFDDNRAQSPLLWGKDSLLSNKGELFMSPEMRSSPIHPFTSPAIYLSDPASLLM